MNAAYNWPRWGLANYTVHRNHNKTFPLLSSLLFFNEFLILDFLALMASPRYEIPIDFPNLVDLGFLDEGSQNSASSSTSPSFPAFAAPQAAADCPSTPPSAASFNVSGSSTAPSAAHFNVSGPSAANFSVSGPSTASFNVSGPSAIPSAAHFNVSAPSAIPSAAPFHASVPSAAPFHVSAPSTTPSKLSAESPEFVPSAFPSSFSPVCVRSRFEPLPLAPGIVSRGLEDLFTKLLLTKRQETKDRTILKISALHGSELVSLAQTSIGIHAVLRLIQDAMESVNSSKCITAALEPDALNLMMNPIGYSVVVACLTNLSYESNLCFIQAGVSNFDGLAFHATGCRTLQLVIEKAEGHIRDKLFEKIASRFIDLAMNCSGNYLVQHAVYLNEPGFNTVICETLVQHLRGLSLDRYGHYVVQKFLGVSSRETAHRVVQAIIMLGKHTVKKIWGNRYGKDVIGAALSVAMETDLMSQLLSALN